MLKVLSNSHKIAESGVCYKSSFEHILDELACFDLLLYLQILIQGEHKTEGLMEQLKGLMLSQDDVLKLFADNSSHKTFSNEVKSVINDLAAARARIENKKARSIENGVYLSLPHISRLFNLNKFEEKCIIVCLAVEIDNKYGKIYAYLQDDVTRKKPSIDFLMKLLCTCTEERIEARSSFDPDSPLCRYIFYISDGFEDQQSPFICRCLRLQDRITDFLLGFSSIDSNIRYAASITYPNSQKMLLYEEIKKQAVDFIEANCKSLKERQKGIMFCFYGPYGSGKKSFVKGICGSLGFPVIIADMEKLLMGDRPFNEAVMLIGREAMLQQAVVCIDNFDSLIMKEDSYQVKLKYLLETVEKLSPLSFILSKNIWKPSTLLNNQIFISVEIGLTDDKNRRNIWESFLECTIKKIKSDGLPDLDELSGKFCFTPGQIEDAVLRVRDMMLWKESIGEEFTLKDFYSICHGESTPRLGELAQKINPRYSFDDIVLPHDQCVQLKEICNQVKCRHIVYDDWGFGKKNSRGIGLNVLFSGPPGTGKTMAAEVIANELGLELYKIDLSQMVSKYIGETEKNLGKLFYEARTSNVILFFDEADALFGKRSEVKDAHDRYANIEIAYLLQKMEEYDGITILATNLRGNMDEAFTRRMSFCIDFPLPDQEYRKDIWEKSFPHNAPRKEDIDTAYLANKFKLSGGNIKNIVLAAAFYAAENSQIIDMENIICAVKREYQKMGRICMKSDFGE